MKHLYFVRHGESELNVTDVVSGHIDTPLTKKGLQQADETGRSIKASSVSINKVYSSPLKRAHHTAIGIVKHLDYDEDSIELLELIKERDVGELAGKNMVRDFGINLDVYYEDEREIDHIPGMERLEDLYTRAIEAIEFLKHQPEDTILIVGHSAFGRALYRAAKGLPFNKRIPKFKNAEIVKLI